MRVCSAEKPAVAKKVKPVRSMTNHWVCVAFRNAYSTNLLPLAASSSPRAETTAVEGCGQRVSKWAEWHTRLSGARSGGDSPGA